MKMKKEVVPTNVETRDQKVAMVTKRVEHQQQATETEREAVGLKVTEGIDKIAEEAAFKYIETIDGIEDQEDTTWRKVCKAGDQLLSSAGSVEKAAVALWIARERLGRHNLQGVDDPDMEGLLHPDHLAYL